MNRLAEGYTAGMQLLRDLLTLEEALNHLYLTIEHRQHEHDQEQPEQATGKDRDEPDSSLTLVYKSIAGEE